MTAPRDAKVVVRLECFDHDGAGLGVSPFAAMREAADGAYVSHAEHARELADVEAENGKLVTQALEWAERCGQAERALAAATARGVALRIAGTLLSNIAYNAAQSPEIPADYRWPLDDARKRWDAALAGKGAGS